jgi:two-component system chemotaxis sensor kinase CheA
MDIMTEFLTEAFDTVDSLDETIQKLAENPSDKKHLADAYRCLHSIHGTCGFLGLSVLETLTGEGESMLGRLQSGQIEYSLEIQETIRTTAASVRRVLERVRETGSDGNGE